MERASREPAGRVDVERTYYRIVRSLHVSEDDFKSAKELGKPLIEPALERQWAEGLSVYDTIERAANRARRFRYNLGRFVVAITLPVGVEIEVEQTGNDPHHFTLYGDPIQLLGFATDPPKRIDQEESR